MLISALCNYYDVLADKGCVLPDGYSKVRISYLIELNTDGTISNITDCRWSDPNVAKGKPQPREMIFPKRTQKSAIESNVIEHRGQYIFGLSFNTKDNGLVHDSAKKHTAFVEKNEEFFKDLDSDLSIAFFNFLTRWNPEGETSNEKLKSLGKEINTASFGFCLSGRPDKLLHEDELVKNAWETYRECKEEENQEKIAQCSILGEDKPIARIHNKIVRFPNGSATGNVLVGFKESSFDSYGASQSYNSNISVVAMEKYTEAFNYLISSETNRTIIDDITFLHWSANGNEKCDDIMSLFICKNNSQYEDTDRILKDIFRGLQNGTSSINDEDLKNVIEPSEMYYIVGIKANSARLSVKYMCCQNFGKIFQNLMQHVCDMSVLYDSRPVTIWKIMKELTSTKNTKKTNDKNDKGDSGDKVDPSLMVKIMQSIMMGTPYPNTLLSTIIRRVRTDLECGDINIRMGIIKACINRKDRFEGKKEEITLSLDVENRNPAYICGRLFAVLEGVQQKAAGCQLNRTIRDSYFSSASIQPAVVFPRLLSLTQHHQAKIDDGIFKKCEIPKIQKLIDMLGSSFPSTLSLKEQGIFMLGYYQQKAETDKNIEENKRK